MRHAEGPVRRRNRGRSAAWTGVGRWRKYMRARSTGVLTTAMVSTPAACSAGWTLRRAAPPDGGRTGSAGRERSRSGMAARADRQGDVPSRLAAGSVNAGEAVARLQRTLLLSHGILLVLHGSVARPTPSSNCGSEGRCPDGRLPLSGAPSPRARGSRDRFVTQADARLHPRKRRNAHSRNNRNAHDRNRLAPDLPGCSPRRRCARRRDGTCAAHRARLPAAPTTARCSTPICTTTRRPRSAPAGRRARPHAAQRRARDRRQQPSQRRHEDARRRERGHAEGRRHGRAVRAPVSQPRRLHRLAADPSIVEMVLRELAAGTEAGPIAAWASSTSTTAPMPTAPTARRLMQLAEQRGLVGAGACRRRRRSRSCSPMRRRRALIWAHTGIGGAPMERVRALLQRHPTLLGELSYRPGLTDGDGRLSAAVAGAARRDARALPGRLRHLGQRPLGRLRAR